jgi:CubicO group peptidase (beta-lactamase class C family)
VAPAALGSDFAAVCGQALAAADVPGAAVGVLHRGGQWTGGFGVTERGGGIPVRPETTFRVASVSKPFTATLALSLAGSRVLDFAEVVPAPAPGVTVRHLLAHLCGFESECGDLARFGEGDDALARLAAELQRQRQRQLVAPGELWSYCNAGYWLLAHILEERSGTSYESALAERVLRPLGLRATTFGEPDTAGHDPHPQRPYYPRARRPSGGLTSNVSDLLAFARFHLEASATAALRAPAAVTPGGSYGYGLMLEPVGKLRLWGHVGSWGGYESRLFFEPEHAFAFVALANSGAAGAVLRDLQDAAVERVLGVRRVPAETVPVPAERLALLAGRYVGAEAEVAFSVESGGLRVDATAIAPDGTRTRQEPTHARPLGERLFEIAEGDGRGSRFDFHPAAGDPRFVRFGSRLASRREGAQL